MKKLLIALFLTLLPTIAFAETQRNPCYYTPTNQPGSGPSGSGCVPVAVSNPLPVGFAGYPSGVTPITGNATGTTGAVVATLAAVAGKTTYICGFHIDSTGSGAFGPITLAGIVTSSMVFQGTAGANNNPSQTFTPCIPASAANTAITITTTADGTATAVDVNSWGYQF